MLDAQRLLQCDQIVLLLHSPPPKKVNKYPVKQFLVELLEIMTAFSDIIHQIFFC